MPVGVNDNSDIWVKERKKYSSSHFTLQKIRKENINVQMRIKMARVGYKKSKKKEQQREKKEKEVFIVYRDHHAIVMMSF